MSTLHNKRILLGITGGIAAYKCCELVRRLRDEQADVRVVMTRAAQAFITPLTLQALSGNPVHTDLLDPAAEAAMGHIELAKWADAIIIAPASADFIARLNCGMADDLLSTLCLASQAPLAIAPAMNQAMWQNLQTQANITQLLNRGIRLFEPAQGSQACGDTGPGRMQEPDQLLQAIKQLFAPPLLTGKNLLITAGPTREAMDPVRYISNYSSGKMGFALARAAIAAGASVSLVTGPVNLATPPGVKRIDVTSAEEMLAACLHEVSRADIFIACAAVADYRPATIAEQKIKKSQNTMQVTMTRNPDIVATIAALADRPYVIGFAAETENLLAHARDKRQRKNLDMIIANNVADPSIGFNSDSNAVTVIDSKDQATEIAPADKNQLADSIIQLVAEHIPNSNNNRMGNINGR